VTVDIFEDFQCPACEKLWQDAGSDIEAQTAAGKIKMRYHVMSFLDSASNGNRYSTRSANAALCASDINAETYAKMVAVLYGKDTSGKAVQPAENSKGRTDIELIDYGKQAGISGTNLSTYQTCVQSEQHKALVQAITDDASKRGVFATPTVLVNGKKVDNVTKATLDAAIAAAAAKAPAPTSSGSATPSTSGSASGSPSGTASATSTGSPTP
jgi:protein-disulfide isomerase